MEIYLAKKGTKHKWFIKIEVEGHLLTITGGKLGLTASSLTKHCGTYEKAIEEAKEKIKEYTLKGYKEEPLPEEPIKELIFDNVSWHINGDFPKDVDESQGYVYTGFYVGWLVINNLMSDDFVESSRNGITLFLQRKITAPKFFEEYMDGFFESHQLSDTGILFSKYYYDLKKGNYFNDYDELLSKSFPSVFYVKDTWENFDKISARIDKRYQDWVVYSKK